MDSNSEWHLAGAGTADVGVGILGSQTDSWSLTRSGVSGAGLIQGKLLGDGCEEVRNVLGCLGRRLEEEEASFTGVRLGVGCGDGTLIRLLRDQIQLVSCKSDDDVLVCLALELLDPRLCLV